MYGIYVYHYYYKGTLNCPQSGPYHHEGAEDRIRFVDIRDAYRFLSIDLNCERSGNGGYSQRGIYYKRHGEYARPLYTIVKLRKLTLAQLVNSGLRHASGFYLSEATE